jgi:hypothetical protein
MDVLVDLPTRRVSPDPRGQGVIAARGERAIGHSVDIGVKVEAVGAEGVLRALEGHGHRLIDRLDEPLVELPGSLVARHAAHGHPADRDPVGDLIGFRPIPRVGAADQDHEPDQHDGNRYLRSASHDLGKV